MNDAVHSTTVHAAGVDISDLRKSYGSNEVILLTKDSSLVYLLGLAASQYELTKFGRDGISSLGAGLTPLLVAGAFYLVITIPLSLLARKFESRSARTKR